MHAGAPAPRARTIGLIGFVIGLIALTTSSTAIAENPWAERQTGYLPARDGTLLKYSVLLPSVKGPFPTIVNYSGYDPGSIGGKAYQEGDTTMDPDLDAKLLQAGYAVLGVNMAGTGCSDGTFKLFANRWGTDGADAIEWAAKQPWSDGRLGMANWSYAGLSQILVANHRPANLKAIAPGMAVTDVWRDVGFPGGVTNYLFPYAWGIFIQSRWDAAAESATADGDDKCLANIAAHNASFDDVSPYSDLTNRPYEVPGQSAWGLPFKRVNKIDVPVLSMVSWQDEATGPRAGYYQDRLDPDLAYMVGSNGPHDNYESDRWQSLLLKFFDRFVKGGKNGFEDKPHVRLWMDSTSPGTVDGHHYKLSQVGPSEVITKKRLPVKVDPLELSLRSGGLLSDKKAKGDEPADTYDYPVRGPAVNDDIGVDDTDWTTDPASQDGSQAYTTAPLKKALTFYGPASLNMWVSTTTPDADIQATITEVRPDGQEMYVQRGWLRLSERKQDKQYSTPLEPFQVHTADAVLPLTGTTPVKARLEINRFAHIFRPGSSIRVILDTPSTTGEWDFDSPTDPTQISVYHDADHPSKLTLGLLKKGGYPAPGPTCGSLLMQPCRPSTFPVPSGVGPTG